MGLLIDPDSLKGIPHQDLQRISVKIEWLYEHRALINHMPLSANLAGFYKRRLGKYRIIYTYDENPDDMVIRLVGLRDDIYRRT
jgi:mRNA interferase RelE/StbE